MLEGNSVDREELSVPFCEKFKYVGFYMKNIFPWEIYSVSLQFKDT